MESYKKLAGTTSPTLHVVGGPSGPKVSAGNGPPNGVVAGALGDLYIDRGDTVGDDEGGLLWVMYESGLWSAQIPPRVSLIQGNVSTGAVPAAPALLLQNSFRSKGGSIDVTCSMSAWNTQIGSGIIMQVMLNNAVLPNASAQMTPSPLGATALVVGSMSLMYRIPPTPPGTIQEVQLWWSNNDGGAGVATIDAIAQSRGPVGAWLRTQEVFP